MNSFLVDVNLPKYFSYFNEANFVFVSDLDLQMSDNEIWNYALKHNMIVLTKDIDFYLKFLISEIKPKNNIFSVRKLFIESTSQLFQKQLETTYFGN